MAFALAEYLQGGIVSYCFGMKKEKKVQFRTFLSFLLLWNTTRNLCYTSSLACCPRLEKFIASRISFISLRIELSRTLA